MINTAVKQQSVRKKRTGEINKGSIYLLPKWEKIKTIPVSVSRFFFFNKTENLFLFRKFSSVNMIEKYSLRDKSDKTIASFGLKVYKDSVYVIDTDIRNFDDFENKMTILFQVAVEKALYNTTEKKVCINLSMPFLVKSKLRKVLTDNDFIPAENQSKYEKILFGEELCLDANGSSKWFQKISKLPLLINK